MCGNMFYIPFSLEWVCLRRASFKVEELPRLTERDMWDLIVGQGWRVSAPPFSSSVTPERCPDLSASVFSSVNWWFYQYSLRSVQPVVHIRLPLLLPLPSLFWISRPTWRRTACFLLVIEPLERACLSEFGDYIVSDNKSEIWFLTNCWLTFYFFSHKLF